MGRIFEVSRKNRFMGEPIIPGDKSISHRSIMLCSVAQGKSRIKYLADGIDCSATIEVMKRCGVPIECNNRGEVEISGVSGSWNLKEPDIPLNCLNSGTTARLSAGLLSSLPGLSIITGDASLRNRPMKRIVDPLRMMGAGLTGRCNDELLPLAVRGYFPLKPIEYELPIPSAQLKSAVLMAALGAEGVTKIRQNRISRNHTELSLKRMGISIISEDQKISVCGPAAPNACDFIIPADPSSAAFFVVAAATHPGSEIILRNICLNPTRIAYIDVLKRMGANIQCRFESDETWEPVGDIHVKGGNLEAVDIRSEEIALVSDEIPALAVAMAVAKGVSRVCGADELRKKESDRINSIATEFRAFGVEIEELNDGFTIEGRECLSAPQVSNSHRDHRIAMSLAILGTHADGTTLITDFECVDISFPGFSYIFFSTAL